MATIWLCHLAVPFVEGIIQSTVSARQSSDPQVLSFYQDWQWVGDPLLSAPDGGRYTPEGLASARFDDPDEHNVRMPCVRRNIPLVWARGELT